LSRLDASSVPEKQRACSALDAVSLGTGCILHRQEVEKKEMVISGMVLHRLTDFLHISVFRVDISLAGHYFCIYSAIKIHFFPIETLFSIKNKEMAISL
jgi:hypothetical protein